MDDAPQPPPAAAPRDVLQQHTYRYYFLPRQRNWEHLLAQLDIGATSCHPALDWWSGGLPVPKPPGGAASSSWLLPTTEPTAILVARWADHLRAAGWKLLSAPEPLIEELGDKAKLHRRAEGLGLGSTMPLHYESPADAVYPCLARAPCPVVAASFIQSFSWHCRGWISGRFRHRSFRRSPRTSIRQ